MFARLLVPIALVGVASSAYADGEPWTLDRVIATARARAPAATVARAQADESRAALVGARQLATRNPVVAADLGPRWADGRSTDVQAQLSVPLDLGRRDRRIAVAEAEIGEQAIASEAALRQASAAAVSAYYGVLYAERTRALAEDRVRLAIAAEAVAAQRNKAGDVSDLEVKLARGELARAQGSVAGARGDVARARGELAIALGVPLGELATIAGDLGDRARLEAAPAGPRPELQRLAQEAKRARAEASLARAEAWPSFDLRVGYQHERDADIVLGGVAVALPLFARGQGDAARADARAKRSEAELATRTSLGEIQRQSAQLAYAAAVEAAQLIEQTALPLATDNEAAAALSYRAGKIDFATLLVIRREALETRREHLDRLREAALAGVALWIAQGTNPETTSPHL